ncbi:uncharacterized protein LOC133895092 [Phragmites australis]|uniref:uncharacterized protein LOC133895092 n=1 Tax=Phragmites australis TaxID=29695 RepID=UPI002D789C23|nr:uncharacterized protein LOC133895092 [Phragmites australis]
MALCVNPDWVALQVKLPEFDAQGLVDWPGCQNPGTIQIPRVDEAVGERAESGPARTGGAGTVGGGSQASGGASAGTNRHIGGGGATGGGAAMVLEDRGKRPRLFIPVPESPPSPSPGEGGNRDDQSSSARPPTGAAESQGRLEEPKSAPALEPSAPEPSAPAGPGPSITAAEPGPPSTATELGPPSTVAEPGPASAVAEPGPANVAAETEMQPPPCSEPTTVAAPERPAPSESTPSAPSVGRMTARQFSGTLSPPEEAHRGASAQPPPSQPADPLPIVLGSAQEVIGRLEATVAGEMAQQEAERVALVTERAHLTAAWRVFDSRLATARAANEDERHAMVEEQKALEQAHA